MNFRLRSLHLALIAGGAFGLASCASVAPPATNVPAQAAAAAATDVAAAASKTAATITDPKSAEGAQAVAASARASAATAVAAIAAGSPPAAKNPPIWLPYNPASPIEFVTFTEKKNGRSHIASGISIHTLSSLRQVLK